MTKTTISAGRPTGAKNVIIEARLSRNQTIKIIFTTKVPFD
jgi:hypothetical protein